MDVIAIGRAIVMVAITELTTCRNIMTTTGIRCVMTRRVVLARIVKALRAVLVRTAENPLVRHLIAPVVLVRTAASPVPLIVLNRPPALRRIAPNALTVLVHHRIVQNHLLVHRIVLDLGRPTAPHLVLLIGLARHRPTPPVHLRRARRRATDLRARARRLIVRQAHHLAPHRARRYPLVRNR